MHARTAIIVSLPHVLLAASLDACVVGGGASGLLLAHRLLGSGNAVTIIEARPDPRLGTNLEGRAYALGLGLRGRTAVKAVDDKLWDAVASAGYGSDRFTLHLPFGALDLRKPSPGQEPSVLIYQTDLCSALLTELEERHGASGRLRIEFDTRVASIDAVAGSVMIEGDATPATFDVVAGCDGVQSAVRASIADQCASFTAATTTLPGSLKVVRLDTMPSPLSPDAVHVVPGVGGLSAFLEPTNQGACALINWRAGAGGEAATDPGELRDAEEARELLASSLPLIADALNTTAVGEQFVSQRVSTAATVRCNTYHYGKSVLLGDAAHSTGGASGQGCNSALGDAIALSEALAAFGHAPDTIPIALARYSRERVPEGHALLDLSTGPGRTATPFRRVLFAAAALRDTLLSRVGIGEPPLQTELTTSLTPFAEIRRRRADVYGDFPTEADFAREIGRVALDSVL